MHQDICLLFIITMYLWETGHSIEELCSVTAAGLTLTSNEGFMLNVHISQLMLAWVALCWFNMNPSLLTIECCGLLNVDLIQVKGVSYLF